MKLRGIYAITNRLNGRCYIGASADIQSRWQSHLDMLGKGKHHCPALQIEWRRYGSDCFDFTVIEPIPLGIALRPYEDKWMAAYMAVLYNANPLNKLGPTSRVALSIAEQLAWSRRVAEGRDELSLAQRKLIARTTRKWARRADVRERMRANALAQNAAANLRTPEAIERNRQALTGKPKDERHREAMRAKHRSGTCKCHPRPQAEP